MKSEGGSDLAPRISDCGLWPWAADSTAATWDLSALASRASDPAHPLTPSNSAALTRAAAAFRGAGRIVASTGGKAGRIGESVVQTALVYATLLALERTRRSLPPVTIVVDDGVRELFSPPCFQERFWREIEVVAAPTGQAIAVAQAAALEGFEPEALLLDFHGGQEGAPYLRTERVQRGSHAPPRTLHTAGSLFRTAVLRYAARGPERRYADFVEALFSLPPYSMDGYAAQPAILLTAAEREEAGPMLRRLGVAPGTFPFLCFFQSVAVAKCYDSWWDVIRGIAQAAASLVPGRQVAFLVVCGPNESGRAGMDRADLEAIFGSFRTPEENATLRLCEIASLRDIAILATRCVTLANDTGPGHVCAAAGSPVITPYLPGDVYPKRVWASTPRHRGVTAEPSPFSHEEVKNAVLWGENHVLSAIRPEVLVQEAVRAVELAFKR